MNFKLWLENAEQVPAEQIEKMVRSLHYYERDFEEGNLLERIWKYPYYVLKEIPISKIYLDEWQVDEDRVQENIEEYHNNPDYPPIVFDWKRKSIIDGIHRANALARLGLKKIKAYVGAGKWD